MIIDKLGPVKRAELTVNDFMVFVGSQATGKSTIAKVIFFFRTIKDDILSLVIKKSTINTYGGSLITNFQTDMYNLLRDKFLGTFGSSLAMDDDMQLEYEYYKDTYIRIKLENQPEGFRNFVKLDNSRNISDFFMQIEKALARYRESISESEITSIKEEAAQLFHDNREIVYIPAGRSMITLLATQWNYIYSTLDDVQKRTIDLCTRSYLENIIKQRPNFVRGLLGIEHDNYIKARKNEDVLTKAKELSKGILKGDYRFSDGEDRLDIGKDHYVKINFASSGQQEALWIVNLLFYYLVQGNPTFFIIEEPESHLFPDSQKLIVELISIVNNAGHSVLITTHSPYVLGSINNLIYAGLLPEICGEAAERILDRNLWLKKDCISGWLVKEGGIENCIDDEIGLVRNELIDEISGIINDDFDRLASLKLDYDEVGE
jgi:predicted ATP-dependent endonuclease of OLD family